MKWFAVTNPAEARIRLPCECERNVINPYDIVIPTEEGMSKANWRSNHINCTL